MDASHSSSVHCRSQRPLLTLAKGGLIPSFLLHSLIGFPLYGQAVSSSPFVCLYPCGLMDSYLIHEVMIRCRHYVFGCPSGPKFIQRKSPSRWLVVSFGMSSPFRACFLTLGHGGCPRPVLCSPCPSSGVDHFSREPCSSCGQCRSETKSWVFPVLVVNGVSVLLGPLVGQSWE